MKKICTHFLKNSDSFAKPVQIYFNKEKKVGTYFGLIMSYMIYSLIFALMISLGLEFIQRKKPKTTMMDKFQPNPDLVSLKNKSIVFSAFFLNSSFQQVSDPSILKFNFIEHTVLRKNNTLTSIKKNLNTKNCKEYYSVINDTSILEYFKNNNLGEANCFGLHDDNLIIGGKFGSEFYSLIQIYLNKCINSSDSNIICKSEEEINKALTGGYFEIAFIDKYIDVFSFEKPFVNYFSMYYNFIDPKLLKITEFYLKKVNVFSDSGFIFESFENKEEYIFDKYNENIVTARDNLIINFQIIISFKNTVYSRDYLKVQEFAATIGGILKFLLFIGFFLNSKLVEFKIYEKMIDSLFTIYLNENIEERKNDDCKSDVINVKNFVNESQFKIFKNSYPIQINPKIQNNLQKLKIIKTEESKYKFTYSEICCNCKRNQKQSKAILSNLLMSKLNKYLDYLEIIKTLQQFHHMKKIIFNKNQNNLFKYNSKTIINGEYVEKHSKKSMFNNQKYVYLYESYVKSKTKEKVNKIDKKILKYFDKVLKSEFEKKYSNNA